MATLTALVVVLIPSLHCGPSVEETCDRAEKAECTIAGGYSRRTYLWTRETCIANGRDEKCGGKFREYLECLSNHPCWTVTNGIPAEPCSQVPYHRCLDPDVYRGIPEDTCVDKVEQDCAKERGR